MTCPLSAFSRRCLLFLGLAALPFPVVATITVEAGPNQTLIDFNGDGREFVTFDGTGTLDPENTAQKIEWFYGAEQVGTGYTPTVQVFLGTYVFKLAITDTEGTVRNDSVTMRVRSIVDPTPDAGPDQTVFDDDHDGKATIFLDGSASSDPDGAIRSYEWLVRGEVLSRDLITSITLPPGEHTVILHAIVADGTVYADEATVTVAWAPTVTASDQIAPHLPPNTLDGDLATRWAAEGTPSILYDLHMTTRMKAVSIAFFRGDERASAFSLDVSLDGANWNTVFTGQSSGASNALEVFDFDDVPARYVRIRGAGNTVDTLNSYTEVALDWELTAHDGNANGLPDAWEQVYVGGLFPDSTTDHDGDLFDALTEWIWGTDPMDPDVSPRVIIESQRAGVAQLRFRAPLATGIGYVDVFRQFAVESNTTLEADDWTLAGVFDVTPSNRTIRTVPFPVAGVDRFLRVIMSLEPLSED
jgi:hypothetical protein